VCDTLLRDLGLSVEIKGRFMYLPDTYSVMVSDGSGPTITSVTVSAKTSAPWDRVTSPSYVWSQLADAAVERNNTPEAIAMIEFAYWAADANEAALPGVLATVSKELTMPQRMLPKSSKHAGSMRS
jgi:hypothetical protein